MYPFVCEEYIIKKICPTAMCILALFFKQSFYVYVFNKWKGLFGLPVGLVHAFNLVCS